MEEVLILAGSVEGHALAEALPEARAVLPAPLRTDPGGVAYEVVPDWHAGLVSAGHGPVVLATHPGDPALRETLPAACVAAGRPLLHLCRPAWQPAAGDLWHLLETERDLPGPIPEGARVFVGLGREVRRFEAALAGRYLVIRQLASELNGSSSWPGPEKGQGHFLESAAPFSVADEIETLRKERIDWLLLRNAGGTGGWPKLQAARALGLPVVLLPRPALMPGVPVVGCVAEALGWLKASDSGQGPARTFRAETREAGGQ